MTSPGPNLSEYNDQEYQGELAYLIAYCEDDWLGFSVITGSAATMLGSDYSISAERELCLCLIEDLQAAGAHAGDMTSDRDHPFAPWPLDKRGSLSRIRHKMEVLGRSPDSGDICCGQDESHSYRTQLRIPARMAYAEGCCTAGG